MVASRRYGHRSSRAYEGRPVIGSLAMGILWPYDIDIDIDLDIDLGFGLGASGNKIRRSDHARRQCQADSCPTKLHALKHRPADGAFGYDGCYGRYPLVLGRSELERLHMDFATKEKVVYFTKVDGK